MVRPVLRWQCKGAAVESGSRTLVMGILNVTTDSFSDGGRFIAFDDAVAQGERMLAEGADILDVGGESTRPGAAPVSVEEEIHRVIPVVRELARRAGRLVSVDTSKAAVADEALRAGAHIVNDVTAMTGDPAMAGVVAKHGAGVVLMHMQGSPRTMQQGPRYDDVVEDVARYLEARLAAAVGAGVGADAIVLDPGIGFGKTVEHNVKLLAGLGRLAAAGRPVLVGLSRKSFLGRITGREVGDRLAASVAGAAYAALRGARIVRVHDVKETCEALQVVDILMKEES